jgi:NitT/TauT family transport system substrate-binding protein
MSSSDFRRCVTVAFAFLLLLNLSVTRANALEKVKLLVAVRNIDEAFSPFVVAKEKGYFASEGYDVTLIATGGSDELAIQISVGNAEIGAASPGEALVGIQSGMLNVRYYYNLYYSNIFSIAVLPDSQIKTIADLKGARIGVQAMGSSGVTFGRAFVQAGGLNPEKDVTFMPIGIGAQAITSIRKKMVDASIYWDAAFAKFKFSGLDLRELPSPEVVKSLPGVSLLTRSDTISKNPKMLIGIARAIAKGYDYSMANPEAAVLITWKAYPEARSKNPDPSAAMKEGVAVNQGRLAIWNLPKNGDKHGMLFEADWERLIQFFVDQKVLPAAVPVARVITNQFIDDINKYDRGEIIESAIKDRVSHSSN